MPRRREECLVLTIVQVEELDGQLQNTLDELKTEKALGKINQNAAADEVARAREEIKVGGRSLWRRLGSWR